VDISRENSLDTAPCAFYYAPYSRLSRSRTIRCQAGTYADNLLSAMMQGCMRFFC
jgi:hypothetical protein